MDFVDDQDDVPQLLDLFDETLHAALKLAPELGACHKRGQVQQVDLLVLELIGHVALENLHGQALGDGRFAHAGLTDEAGVVLLAAIQDLDHALQLLVPADHFVQLALGSLAGQGDAVVLQKFAFGAGLAFGLFCAALGLVLAALGGGGGGRLVLFLLLAVHVAHEAVEEGEGGGAALFFVLVVVPLSGHVPERLGDVADQVLHALGAVKGGHHLVGQALQLFVAQAHLFDHIGNRADVQLPGAFQTKAFVVAVLAVGVQAGDKDHGHVLFASAAKGRFHRVRSLLCGVFIL